MYYVYILANEENTKYVGVTNNLKRRIAQHKNGDTKTSDKLGTKNLIWYCAFLDKEKAYSFEKYLKSSSGFAFRNKRLI